MERDNEFSQILKAQESFLHLLSRLYSLEVDQPLFDKLLVAGLPEECGDAELTEGYHLIAGYLRQAPVDPVTDLAVDYARVFLGAGTLETSAAAYPYESVYTSSDRLVMQQARDEVLAIYRRNGLDKSDSVDVPEDHLGLECTFLAHITHRALNALDHEDWPALSASLKEQRTFLLEHLQNWVPAFCADIGKYARTDFYRGVAKITAGFLRLEGAVLDDLIAEAIGKVA